MNFYLNSLSRRAAVQAIYQQITYKSDDLLAEVLDPEHLISEGQMEKELFESIIISTLKSWESWEEIIQLLKKEGDVLKLSRCAEAIIRCASAEILEKNIPISVIINEYLELSKIFCEKEAAFVNKILDSFACLKSNTNTR